MGGIGEARFDGLGVEKVRGQQRHVGLGELGSHQLIIALIELEIVSIYCVAWTEATAVRLTTKLFRNIPVNFRCDI